MGLIDKIYLSQGCLLVICNWHTARRVEILDVHKVALFGIELFSWSAPYRVGVHATLYTVFFLFLFFISCAPAIFSLSFLVHIVELFNKMNFLDLFLPSGAQ